MRISTNMLYDLGVGSVQKQYSDLLKIQQQMATGRRVLTPSDDPIASARALEVTQSQSATDQYSTNGKSASSALSMQDSVLSQVTDLLQNVRTIAVNAGNATLSNSDRQSQAAELQGYYSQLLALANGTDGNGQYLFSGYKGSTQPFSQTATGVVYNGDQGERLVQIGSSQQISVSSSGAEVFQLNKNGNGTFVTSANYSTVPVNAGSGIISPGVVLDPTKWNSAANNKNFTIKFDVTNGQTTYDIIDNVAGTSLLTGAAPAAAGPYPRTYISGGTIDLKSQGAEPPFDFGATLSISGQPSSGDTFTVKASSSNQDIFATLQSLITSLQTPIAPNTAAGNTQLTNSLNTALSNIDIAHNNMLSVRAKVGANLKAVDDQTTTNDSLSLQYTTTLSNLQDLDYAKAISDLTQKQAGLDAAQKSFLKVQGLSLFNYINP